MRVATQETRTKTAMELNRQPSIEHRALAMIDANRPRVATGFARHVVRSVRSSSFAGEMASTKMVVRNEANVRGVTDPSFSILPKGTRFRLHPRFSRLK
jgi:hypothetical protein